MITFGHDCPYCAKRDVAFTIRHITSNVKESAYYRDESFHTIFATCNHCLNGISALYHVADSDYINGLRLANKLISAVKDDISYFLKDIFECELNWYPKAPKLDIPYHLPEDVERKFSAGEKIYFQTKHDESMI